MFTISSFNKIPNFLLQLPTLAVLGLVASTHGAPRWTDYAGNPLFQSIRKPFQPFQQNPIQYGQGFKQPFQPGRIQIDPQPTGNSLNSSPLGITVDFDSSFGK